MTNHYTQSSKTMKDKMQCLSSIHYMLDLNQMYVNCTEMADAKYGISEADQRATEEFYNNEKGE